MPDIFDEIAPDNAGGGDIFDEIAPDTFGDIDPFSPDSRNLRRVMENFPNERAQREWDKPTISREEHVKRSTWRELGAGDKLAADLTLSGPETGFKSGVAGLFKGLRILEEHANPTMPQAMAEDFRRIRSAAKENRTLTPADMTTPAEAAQMEAEWRQLQSSVTPEQLQADQDNRTLPGRIARRIEATIPESPQPSNVSRPIAAVGNAAGSLASSMMFAPLGPAGVTEVMFLMELSDAYDSEMARQQDVGEPLNPDKAFLKANLYAPGSAALEYIGGAGRLARRWFGLAAEQEVKELARRGGPAAVLHFFKARATDAAAEGGTEALQRLYQDAIVMGKPNLAAALIEGGSAAGGSLLLGGLSMGARLGGHKANQAFVEARQNQAAQDAITQSGQAAALMQSLPMEGTGEARVMNRAADESFAQPAQSPVRDIFDEVASESQAPQTAPVASDTSVWNKAPSTPAAATPAGAEASEQVGQPVVQQKHLVAPPTQAERVRAELMRLPGADQDLMRQAPALTTEQTDAGLRESPADDNAPATKADLMALVNFMQNGGQNPFAAKPSPDANTPSGKPDATGKPAQTITGSNVQTGTEMPVQSNTGAAKPTFTVGQKVAVRLSNRSNKEHLARITQLQPDGSAQVQIEGEKTFRMVTANQLMLTKTDRARLAKREELAAVPAEQQEQVKADAAEFAVLVEDYAPQLEWAPGEAYDRNTVMQEQGVENGRLRNAAIERAMRTVLPEGQWNSVVDRARALPLLEAYLKQKFPGDNSIAKRRALEEFGRSETPPQETAAVERDQATLDQLAARYPRKAFFQGLRAVGRSVSRGQNRLAGQSGGKSGGKGALSAAGASTVTELERIFGVRIIFVDGAEFNGVKVSGSNVILINTKSPRATMAIAGHELLHHIKATHPGLYADFVAQARALLKNNAQFRAELARKGYSNLTDDVVTEEMFADVLGDAVLDPVFLQQLAKAEPNLFKRFARTAVTWLEKLIAKAKAVAGFNSAPYVTDLTVLREQLVNLLRDAGRQTQFRKAGLEVGARDMFSMEDGDLFGAPESVEEQRARLSREKAQKAQADARKTMEERAGARLIGKDLDTTQEMFGAEIKRDKTGQGDMFSKERSAAIRYFDKAIKTPYGSRYYHLTFNGDWFRVRLADHSNQSSNMDGGAGTENLFRKSRAQQAGVGMDNPHFLNVLLKEPVKTEVEAKQIIARVIRGLPDGAAYRIPLWQGTPNAEVSGNDDIHVDARGETYLYEFPPEDGARRYDVPENKRASQGEKSVSGDSQENVLGSGSTKTGEQTSPQTTTSDKSVSLRNGHGVSKGDMFSKEAGPRWRSNIQSALASWQNKGTPEQLRAHLAKTKGAMDEAEWIGLDDFLKDKTSATKQQVLEFVKANTVEVQEVEHEKSENSPLNYSEAREAIASGKEIWPASDRSGRPLTLAALESTYDDRDYFTDARGGIEDTTKFSQYQLPGGENYRELLLTLPGGVDIEGAQAKMSEEQQAIEHHKRNAEQLRQEQPNNRVGYENAIRSLAARERRYQQEKQRLDALIATGKPAQFKSSHFDEPNILAHVRFNERTDAEGNRVLFIEEVQSDWHQQGRKLGYDVDQNPGGWTLIPADSVPNAPFKQTWPMLAMKRMIRYASENGFDRVAWTTGEQQNERYDLAKQVDSIKVTRASATDFEVKARKNGETVLNKAVEGKQGLADLIGKDLAQKAVDEVAEGDAKEYSGADLKVGGKGMRKFYDEMLPGEVNKFVKKWGGRVGQGSITTNNKQPRIEQRGNSWAVMLGDSDAGRFGSRTLAEEHAATFKPVTSAVHSLDITPAMKGAALEGFDMFSLPKPDEQSEFAKVQADITAAEAELMEAIRNHMNPPAGMRKAEALAAKNDAHRKLRDLLGKQLKMMVDIRNLDAARSPEETAELISQTVDLLNSIQDEISQRTARSQEVLADLTKLRQDLQTRLNLLKGWADDQTDEAAQGIKPTSNKPETLVSRIRYMEIEGATNPSKLSFPYWHERFKKGIKKFLSPIPELPLFGDRARFTSLFKRGYRLFAVENNRVKKEAAEKVKNVLEPLAKLNRTPADNDALQRYYRLAEKLSNARKAGDETRVTALAEQLHALETTVLNKDPFNLFRRLVLYRDFYWRGTYLKNDEGKPIALPGGLTPDEVLVQLRRITKAITEHPDGLAITEALRRHYALMEELRQSILAHGEIIPEALNNPTYFPHLLTEYYSDNLGRVNPTTEESFRKYLITPVGSERLIQTDYIKAVLQHTAEVLSHNARADLVEKYWQSYDISEQLKEQHGDKWDRAFNLPPGYSLYAPYKKLPLRSTYILSRDVLAKQLGVLFNDGDLRERMAGKVVKVKPEDLRTAMVAGEKIKWALPTEIVDALHGIEKREAALANQPDHAGAAAGKVVRRMMNYWKQLKLFGPTAFARYSFGNLTTDAIDKVLVADPKTAGYMRRAARELWRADQGEQTPEFKAASREGVFETITAGEVGKLEKLPEFREFMTTGQVRKAKADKVAGAPAALNSFRESTFRYAKFLADVERLRAGEEIPFTGMYHKDIDALGALPNGKKAVLEGEELIYAKAAENSLRHFGDYNMLAVNTQWLRRYIMPFVSWTDVNLRYHVSLAANMVDAFRPGATELHRTHALRVSGAKIAMALAFVGVAKELWNQFGGPLLGLWDDEDDLENKLSPHDRRRAHIILGKDAKGEVMVMYTPSAFGDVAEWVGGQNFKRLFFEYARGDITLDQWISDYAKQLPVDFGNKLVQSTGPVIKGPYELASDKATFPDIFDQRTIPKSDKWWRFVGTMTDDRIANWVRGVFDEDYYNQPMADQLQQIVLQVRRRDPQSWAYYEIKEQAAEWEFAKTGKRFSQGDYTAPEAMALRNFRRAIYRGDVAAADQFYHSLLRYGYTAERLDASIRNQAPLAGLNLAQQKEFKASMDARTQQQLALAEQYYAKLKALDGREKQLFPKAGKKAEPNPQLLRRVVEEQRR